MPVNNAGSSDFVLLLTADELFSHCRQRCKTKLRLSNTHFPNIIIVIITVVVVIYLFIKNLRIITLSDGQVNRTSKAS